MLKKKKIAVITIISFFVILLTFLILYYFNNNIGKNTSLEELNQIFQKDYIDLPNMQDITKDYIIDTIGIDEKYIVNYVGKMPIVEVSASMYLILETPSKKDAKIVMEKLESFGEYYENSWTSFLLSEKDIIKNRKIGVTDKYAYIVISDNIYD